MSSKVKIKDMTEGKPSRLIFMFALPLIFGNIFQQLYNIVDTIVIGKFIGVEALAAVGAGAWLNWMVIDIIIGFTQGFSILISQYFGENNIEKLRKTVTMSTILAIILAVLMTIISLVAVKPVLILLNTPENIINDALSFLRIAFCGVPAILAYNTCSAILRALGNSRTPFNAIIISSVINVVLDFIFVLVFNLGIIGPAIATVIAQIASFLYCINSIKKLPMLKFTFEDFKIDMYMIKKLIFLGAPISFQNGIIGFGGLVVQYVINGFGFIFVAGFTATNKLYGILELVAGGLGYAIAAFTGQNLGAKKYERIQNGINSALKMAIGTSVILSIVLIIFGRYIVSMFISGNPEEVKLVIDIAYKYLKVMSSMLFILYMLHIYRNALQGMGDTIIPMVSGIVELCMRISVALFLPLLIGETGIYFAEVAAWLGAELILMTAYYIHVNKFKSIDIEIQVEELQKERLEKSKNFSKIKKIFKILIYIGLICFVMIEGLIITYPKYKMGNSDYILVLGAGLKHGKTPSLTLQGRLDAALKCINEYNNTGYIVLSGGKGDDEHLSEAMAMKNYLIDKGVPEKKIIIEDKSRDTNENFKYSKERIEENSGKSIDEINVKIVTTDFHAFRSSILARKNGYVKFENYSSKTVWYLIPVMYTREAFALVKSILFD